MSWKITQYTLPNINEELFAAWISNDVHVKPMYIPVKYKGNNIWWNMITNNICPTEPTVWMYIPTLPLKTVDSMLDNIIDLCENTGC